MLNGVFVAKGCLSDLLPLDLAIRVSLSLPVIANESDSI